MRAGQGASRTSELDLIRRVYEYNDRTRTKYLSAIRKLPLHARYRDREASYPSLVDRFVHVLDAYRRWFGEVNAYGAAPDWYPLGRKYTLAQARREMEAVDRRVRGALGSLRPGDLNRRFAPPKGWHARKRVALPYLLVHMIEEELQHRGEMNTLPWQTGRDPPVTGSDDPRWHSRARRLSPPSGPGPDVFPW